jgi:hypothetical protein
MTGFEVIVRPSILPNIRPAAPRVLAPEDDPSRGIAVLSGSGGGLVNLTRSEQSSWTRSRKTETRRKFDVERIFHMDDEGTVDREQYVDVERLKKLTTRDGTGIEETTNFTDPPTRENVEVLEADQERTT